MSESDNVNIFWLTGSYHLRKHCIGVIRSSFGEHDLYVYSDDISGEYLEHQVLCLGLFDNNRIIILSSIPTFSDISAAKSTKKLKELFDNIPDECIVIVNGAAKRGNIYKYVKEIGKAIEYPKYLKRNSAMTWVRDCLSKLNKDVEDSALDLLVSTLSNEYGKGYDVDTLYMSVRKLCDYVGHRKQVDRSDIIKVLGRNTDFVIWSIFNSFDNRNYSECVRLFEKARAIEKTDLDAAMKILNMSLWRFKLILFLKGCKRQGLSNTDILKKVSELKKIKKQGSDFCISYDYNLDKDENKTPMFSESAAKNMLVGVFGNTPAIDMYDTENILNIFQCVLECFGKIRSGNNELEIVTVMQNFFMTVCGVIDSKTLSRLREYDV